MPSQLDSWLIGLAGSHVTRGGRREGGHSGFVSSTKSYLSTQEIWSTAEQRCDLGGCWSGVTCCPPHHVHCGTLCGRT